MARRIGSTAGFAVDHRGQRLYRLHKHPCGHEDRCNLEHFATGTGCEKCRTAVRPTQQEIDADARYAEQVDLYIRRGTSGPGGLR